ncbi:hypothetical protein Tco_0172824, partial [Tanacetum coccineum]
MDFRACDCGGCLGYPKDSRRWEEDLDHIAIEALPEGLLGDLSEAWSLLFLPLRSPLCNSFHCFVILDFAVFLMSGPTDGAN